MSIDEQPAPQNQPLPESEPVQLTGQEKKALVEDILEDINETIRAFQDSDDDGVQEVVTRLRILRKELRGKLHDAKKWSTVAKQVGQAISWIKLLYDVFIG
jgi:hypothetical protein